jgi:endonuclease/exonuclease/phosphatase family metal-dependent hydrolase
VFYVQLSSTTSFRLVSLLGFAACVAGCDVPVSAAQSQPQQAAASSAAPASPARRNLTIASWNLQWLADKELQGPVARSAADYARLARYAKLLDADIVAVQEVQSEQALARVFDTHRYKIHVTNDRSNQKTGFVYAKHLNVETLPDYAPLALGGLRSGADINVRVGHLSLRLLSVHLKSGCFDKPLNHNRDCAALRAQVPHLEAWIDARASEPTLFAVLGDFNRRWFGQPHDPVWSTLDDAQPAESDLDSPTRARRSTCWSAVHPQYIDHLVLSKSLSARAAPGSFKQVLYDDSDAPFRKKLSDHCPIAVTLTFSADGTMAVAPSLSLGDGADEAPIKGNVSRAGKRLFHTVDCPNYERVKIDLAKGERYFASEEEAQKAGFQRAPGCRK